MRSGVCGFLFKVRGVVRGKGPYNVSMVMDERHVFTRSVLEEKLRECIGKTLEQIDSAHVLASKKRNKGYAGAVIEQSVLGYPADSDRRPDLIVDGVPVELKTTGLIESKKNRGNGDSGLKAKEPVSITAVRPDYIVREDFEHSSFWEKAHRLLFVYYIYAHKTNSPADYGDFPFQGYQFVDFSGEDKELLKRDWETVRDFIRQIQEEYPDDSHAQYPRISTELNRHKLSVIDTSPKWPNPPRFRLKAAFVTAIYNKYTGVTYDTLPNSFDGLDGLDLECHRLAGLYAGKTVGELYELFGIQGELDKRKSVGEDVTVRMFGGKAKRMGKVEEFAKFSVHGKSIVLNKRGGRTEDMKLFPVDFDELCDPNLEFEDSSFYTFFSEYQMLCSVFQEPSAGAPLRENVFLGFKRFSFSDDFIENEVRAVWDQMRSLIFNKQLKIVQARRKDGSLIINKNGEIREAPNWPKSAEHTVFIRGTGADSSPECKPVVINGLSMYRQDVWVKGTYIVSQLEDLPFL